MVARWQLIAAGWTRHAVQQAAEARAWRAVHDGVYATGQAPLSPRQRLVAAVLTAPASFLGEFSAAAVHGFHESDRGEETVVRAGDGGPRRYPGLVVRRSTTLAGATTRVDGLPVLSAARTLADLCGVLDRFSVRRAFREAIRLRTTTADDIARALQRRRGTAALAQLCDRYATIPYHRCRSDAESRALEILHDARIEPPLVNVKLRGPRPDLLWRRHRLIVEIDGPQFHLFADEDARKQAIWEAAGYRVVRISSGEVYAQPARLVALYHANVPMCRP